MSNVLLWLVKYYRVRVASDSSNGSVCVCVFTMFVYTLKCEISFNVIEPSVDHVQMGNEQSTRAKLNCLRKRDRLNE